MESISSSTKNLALIEFPDIFETIIGNAGSQLSYYDDLQNADILPDLYKIRNSIVRYQGKIDTALNTSETRTMEQFKECEAINQWVSVLQSQTETFSQIDNNEKAEVGEFILSFKSNANQLKSLEQDLLQFLRTKIENTTTPSIIRMNQMFSSVQRELLHRQSILTQITKNLDDANERFEIISKENEQIVEDMDTAEKHLKTFTSSQSYQIVQKAKKFKLVEKQWKKRKKGMIKQIADMNQEISDYSNKDKLNSKLAKQNNHNELTYNRAEARFNEEIRIINEEMSIQFNNYDRQMANLHKDLANYRSSQLSHEKRRTQGEVKRFKIQVERIVSKFKKQLQSQAKDLEKEMKKVNSSKNPAPEKILAEIIKYKGISEGFVKTTFDREISELKDIVNRHQENLESSSQKSIEHIYNQHEVAKQLLNASKARSQLRMSERKIELEGVNNRLATVEGIFKDVTEELELVSADHERLSRKLADFALDNDSTAQKIKNEIRLSELFVYRGNQMFDIYQDILLRKINRGKEWVPPVLPDRPKSAAASIGHTTQEEIDARLEKERLEELKRKELLRAQEIEEQKAANISEELIEEDEEESKKEEEDNESRVSHQELEETDQSIKEMERRRRSSEYSVESSRHTQGTSVSEMTPEEEEEVRMNQTQSNEDKISNNSSFHQELDHPSGISQRQYMLQEMSREILEDKRRAAEIRKRIVEEAEDEASRKIKQEQKEKEEKEEIERLEAEVEERIESAMSHSLHNSQPQKTQPEHTTLRDTIERVKQPAPPPETRTQSSRRNSIRSIRNHPNDSSKTKINIQPSLDLQVMSSTPLKSIRDKKAHSARDIGKDFLTESENRLNNNDYADSTVRVLMSVKALKTFTNDEPTVPEVASATATPKRTQSERFHRRPKANNDDSFIYGIIRKNIKKSIEIPEPKEDIRQICVDDEPMYLDPAGIVGKKINIKKTPKKSIKRQIPLTNSLTDEELPAAPTIQVNLLRPTMQRLSSRRGFLQEDIKPEPYSPLLSGSMRFKARRNNNLIGIKPIKKDVSNIRPKGRNNY